MLNTYMNNATKSFATCTPVAFHANDYFFTRDTGLICRELQKMGRNCRVIMPLPAHSDDLPTPDLLRVPARALYSSAWWKEQGLDGVVLYSWGDPRYTGIARAIRRAGIKLIVHFDSSGELHEHLSRRGSKFLNKAKDILINQLRSIHLSLAHTITTSRPCIESLLRDPYYGTAVAEKCVEFPTPVSSCFRYDGSEKQARVICTGSWQLPVKRAGFLMSALKKLLSSHSTVKADICGPTTPELKNWHNALPGHIRSRIVLHGQCTHEKLSRLCNEASISLCTSESEGSHTASAEALCCGCSVVCPPRPLLKVVRWYASRESGTVSTEDTPDSICQALMAELKNWELGNRSAGRIADTWQQCFQVRNLTAFL